MSKKVFLFMNHFNKKKKILLVQDQTFYLSNHAQEVTQQLALEYVHLAISLFGTKI
jgi:hypothetical protein